MQRFVRRTGQGLLTCFLTGVLAILPAVVTIAVVIWVAEFVQKLIGPETIIGGVLRSFGLRVSENQTVAYLIGWVLVLAVVFILGVALEAGAKRLFQHLVDAALTRIPVLGSIYSTSKQVIDLLDKKKGETNLKGMSPVFCFFGGQGGAAVLALLVSADHYCLRDREYVVVIVPTAPVPIGGGLLFVPADCVVPADVSIDALMSIYVSMGATAGQYLSR